MGPERASRFRILVVDDQEDICSSLSALFRHLPGVEVACAGSYAEGRAMALAESWDLVLCDEWLLDGHGTALLAELAERGLPAKRMLMSAYHNLPTIDEGIRKGHVQHFVRKPFEVPEVLRWVEAARGERLTIGSPYERARQGAANPDAPA
jgi:DNA-binding NtrC family response regulator